MSIECGYCERDLRGGHDLDCPVEKKRSWLYGPLSPEHVHQLADELDEHEGLDINDIVPQASKRLGDNYWCAYEQILAHMRGLVA